MVLPAAAPVTIPAVPIVAFAVLLLHVPPLISSVNVVVDPTHTLFIPLAEPIVGDWFTVTTTPAAQPVAAIVYDMVVTPATLPPLTIPLVPTDPVDGALLVQAPPAVASLRLVVAPPEHTLAVPRIAVIGFTVSWVVALQPVDNRYVIVLLPADTPDAIPAVPIVALAVLLLHVPPAISSVNVVVDPTHTRLIPLTEPIVGDWFTVITLPAAQPVDRSVYDTVAVPLLTSAVSVTGDPEVPSAATPLPV